MSVGKVASPVDIAVSGLQAQARRMNLISGNIANINTTRTATGGPYVRQDLLISTEEAGAGGVRVEGVYDDMSSAFKRVSQPGHPDADAEGYVSMPNVDLPSEMIEMVMASRAYQANAAVLKRYQESVDVALELLR